MLKRLAWAAALVVGVVSMVAAQFSPRIDVSNAPSTRLEIVPVDSNHIRAIPASLSTMSGKIPPGSFLLTNKTDQPINAVVVNWSYTDPDGKSKQIGITCDAYVMAPIEPIVRPRAASLITPYGCATDDLFSQMQDGNLMGSPLNAGNVQYAPDLGAPIRIQVDSVIFENGDIWGPDKLQYHHEIEERDLAIKAFVAEVLDARKKGEDLAVSAARIRQETKANLDRQSARRDYYAGLLQRSPNPSGTLIQLQASTRPSQFHHIGEE